MHQVQHKDEGIAALSSSGFERFGTRATKEGESDLPLTPVTSPLRQTLK